ncbi:MAG: acyltransferase [Acidimicrobiia bacterium]
MVANYLRGIDRAVDLTPPSRNRVVDGWRALALLLVVFGHWISASIWVQPDGTILAGNTLEWFPAAEHLTWLFQVMPIFFLAGGYANAAALDGSPDIRTWVTSRVRRLYTPVVPLIVVWVILVAVLRPYIPSNVVHAGTISATLPVWFIAVYLVMVTLAPLTLRWWRRSGARSLLVLAACALSIDGLRFGLDLPAIGWVNYLFVWAFVHQLGYAWFDRNRTDRPVSFTAGVVALAAGLGVLIITTGIGWYPVSMVTIPGGGISNMTPPTFANGFLAIAHAGLIAVSMPLARRLTDRRPVWRIVVAVSAVMMTIYLWHLTALSLLGAAGIFIGDGWLFSFEPGTPPWWWLRVPFFGVLAVLTVVLVAVFGSFERNINRRPPQGNRMVWFAGIVAAIGATALTAFVGIVTHDAAINWYIPAFAVIAAVVSGSYRIRPTS